jgi:hypothetical protein
VRKRIKIAKSMDFPVDAVRLENQDVWFVLLENQDVWFVLLENQDVWFVLCLVRPLVRPLLEFDLLPDRLRLPTSRPLPSGGLAKILERTFDALRPTLYVHAVRLRPRRLCV